MNMVYQSEEGRISYNDTGSGFPVVLLHGYLETALIWESFASRLSEKFRVITPDLPGHGGSSPFGSVHTMELMASVVKDLLHHLGVQRSFIAGHSMGGYVTLAFADQYPDLLSGFCLFHSQPFPDAPMAIEKRMREIALVKEGKKEIFIRENIARMYASASADKFRDMIDRSATIAAGISDEGLIAVLNGMMARPSRLETMENGRVPCLWILGAGDNYIRCGQMRERVKLPSNAELLILENSGHMGFIEEEDAALAALTGFAGRLI